MATQKFYPRSVTEQLYMTPWGGTNYIDILTDGSDSTYVRTTEPEGYLTLGFDFSSLSDDANLTAIRAYARLKGYSNGCTFMLDDLLGEEGPNFANVSFQTSAPMDIYSLATNTDVMELKNVNSIKLHFDGGSFLYIYEFYVIVEGTGIDIWVPYVTVS